MLSKTFVLFSLTLLALSAGNSPVAGDMMIVHNSRRAPPTGFASNGPALAEETIDIRIALTSNNMTGLEDALYDVSTPTSANYRKFLSKEQVNSF
jgi:tripeptidyl-peptidase-1